MRELFVCLCFFFMPQVLFAYNLNTYQYSCETIMIVKESWILVFFSNTGSTSRIFTHIYCLWANLFIRTYVILRVVVFLTVWQTITRVQNVLFYLIVASIKWVWVVWPWCLALFSYISNKFIKRVQKGVQP